MEQDKLQICPFCKERIQAAAIKCRYCGEWLEQKPGSVNERNGHQSESQSEETHIALSAESTPKSSGDAAGPPKIPEIASQSFGVAKLALLTVRRMQLVSVGLLVLSSVVIWLALKNGNLSQKAMSLLAALIGRILICASLLGWLAWSISGKRKGYGLLTFSLVCAAMSFFSAYHFHAGLEKGKLHQRESNGQMVGSIIEAFQQVTNEGPMRALAKTGDADFDTALQPLIDLMNDFKRMEVEISDLNQWDVFSSSVVTNKTAIESELRKRNASQAIIQKYQRDFPAMINSAREKLGSLTIPENMKKGMLRGFEASMKAQAPAREELFSLRLRREKTESELLQFLLSEFEGYHLIDEAITFETPAEQQEYKRLLQNLDTAIKDAEAFQRRQSEAAEVAKGRIKKLAE